MKEIKHIVRATQINRVLIDNAIKEGDVVIDATLGNGNDAEYLANKVGENGRVYGFDIQTIAIENSKKRLQSIGFMDRVHLILDGHENMDKYVDCKASCILFNLGYLPKSDHAIKTKSTTTIEAIKKGLKILDENGVMSITLYTGHDGGKEEGYEVEKLVSNLNQDEYSVLKCNFINQKNEPPYLILIEKIKTRG